MFQSTLPREERPGRARCSARASWCFNPRSRARSDLDGRGGLTMSLRVSIHAPARGATRPSGTFRPGKRCFNPRSRARSDGGDGTGPLIKSMFQSTLPREERQKPPSRAAGMRGVSIHAPARGATGVRRQVERIGEVSIHAPARGATRRHALRAAHARCFNPRSRARSDVHCRRPWPPFDVFQSTLPREERPARRMATPARRCFNPRSRARSDRRRANRVRSPQGFQSTLPREERPTFVVRIAGESMFQSTLPREERLMPRCSRR